MERQWSQRTMLDNLSAAAMIGGPLLWLASSAASALGQGFARDQVGGVLQVYAFAAFIPVMMGLPRLVEPAFPRAAALLTGLGMLGSAGAIGYGVDHIQFGVSGVEAQTLGTAGLLALKIPGICFVLALLGTSLALVRAGVGPRWCPPILGLGAMLFPVANIGGIEALRVATGGLFLVALAPIGWRLIGAPSYRAGREKPEPDRRSLLGSDQELGPDHGLDTRPVSARSAQHSHPRVQP